MHAEKHVCNSLFHIITHRRTAALAIAIVFALSIMATQATQGQTYKVLYNFTGGIDGASPAVGVTMDAAGNLYGTTEYGGRTGDGCDARGCGTAYKLSHRSSLWVMTPLHDFAGGSSDGETPLSRLTIGPDGDLYGTTNSGGSQQCAFGGCGIIYKLSPPAHVVPNATGGWTETVLHWLSLSDGSNPSGDLVFDQAGNIYGTAGYSGPYNAGTVFELVRSHSGCTLNVLYTFTDMDWPDGGVVFDQAGNLYGTTMYGGAGWGTVFQLTPSGSGWTRNIVHSFGHNDGASPYGGVILDSSGNLYGATPQTGAGGALGAVFSVSPAGGGWNFATLHGFTDPDGIGVWGSVVMDQAGNLYGTTELGGDPCWCGTVFRLTPYAGGWTLMTLHVFHGNEGRNPLSNVILDATGNLYGTTTTGGVYGYGVVWEITP